MRRNTMCEITGLLPDLWRIARGYMDVDEQWYTSLVLGRTKGDTSPDPDEILRAALDHDRTAIFRHALETLAGRMRRWNIALDTARLEKLCALDCVKALELCRAATLKNGRFISSEVGCLPMLARLNAIAVMRWARASLGVWFNDGGIPSVITHGRIEMLEDLFANDPDLDESRLYRYAIEANNTAVARWIDQKYEESATLEWIGHVLRVRTVRSAAMARHLLARIRSSAHGHNYGLLLRNAFTSGTEKVIDVLLAENLELADVAFRVNPSSIDDADAKMLMKATRIVTPDSRRDGMRRLLVSVLPRLASS